MAKVRPLHMAKSLEELNKKFTHDKMKQAAPKLLCKTAEKIFLKACDAKLQDRDEEQAYILFMRFLDIVSCIRKSREYKSSKRDFDKLLPTARFTQALDEAEELAKRLDERYLELSRSADTKSQFEDDINTNLIIPFSLEKPLSLHQLLEYNQSKPLVPQQASTQGELGEGWFGNQSSTSLLDTLKTSTSSFPTLSPQQLYEHLQNSPEDVLVMDCRPRTEYNASHVDNKRFPQWLCVPEEIVKKGFSSENVLGFLPATGKKHWKERDKKRWVVLVDDNSTAETLTGSSNNIAILSLMDALHKEDTTVQQEQFVLEGGYAMWYVTCSSLCIGVYKKRENRTEGEVSTQNHQPECLSLPNMRVVSGPIPNPPSYDNLQQLPSCPPVQPPILPPVSITQPNQFAQQNACQKHTTPATQEHGMNDSAKEAQIQEHEWCLAEKSKETQSEREQAEKAIEDFKQQQECEKRTRLEQLESEKRKLKEIKHRDSELNREREALQLQLQLEKAQHAQELEQERQILAQTCGQFQREIAEQQQQMLQLKAQFEREKTLVQQQQKEMLQHLQLRKQQGNERMFSVSQGMPAGWEKRLDRGTGRFYYMDHNTKTMHWNPPTNWLAYQAKMQKLKEMQEHSMSDSDLLAKEAQIQEREWRLAEKNKETHSEREQAEKAIEDFKQQQDCEKRTRLEQLESEKRKLEEIKHRDSELNQEREALQLQLQQEKAQHAQELERERQVLAQTREQFQREIAEQQQQMLQLKAQFEREKTLVQQQQKGMLQHLQLRKQQGNKRMFSVSQGMPAGWEKRLDRGKKFAQQSACQEHTTLATQEHGMSDSDLLAKEAQIQEHEWRLAEKSNSEREQAEKAIEDFKQQQDCEKRTQLEQLESEKRKLEEIKHRDSELNREREALQLQLQLEKAQHAQELEQERQTLAQTRGQFQREIAEQQQQMLQLKAQFEREKTLVQQQQKGMLQHLQLQKQQGNKHMFSVSQGMPAGWEKRQDRGKKFAQQNACQEHTTPATQEHGMSDSDLLAKETQIQEREWRLAEKNKETHSDREQAEKAIEDFKQQQECEKRTRLEQLESEKRKLKEIKHRDSELNREREALQLQLQQEKAQHAQELEQERQILAQTRGQLQREIAEQQQWILQLKAQFEREKTLVQQQQKEMLQHLQLRKQQGNERMFSVSQGMPAGWEKRLDRGTGRFYYMDHNTKTMHWNPPTNWLAYQAEMQKLKEMQEQQRQMIQPPPGEYFAALHSKFSPAVPGPIENLKIDVNPKVPSVTLTWDPPQNVEVVTQCSRSEMKYHIRFKPLEREHYDDKIVDSSTTTIVLKRDSGLIPHATTIFEVKAQCGDDLGEWTAVSKYIAVIPSLVQGLKVLIDEHKPSVTLQWTKPSNIWTVQEVVSHEIRFSPCQSRQYGHRMYTELPPLEGYCHDITLGREQLKPLTTYDFEVRAVSSDGAGEWTVVTKHFSMTPHPVHNLTLTLDRNKPSLTLDWEPPTNIDLSNPAELTQYDIWFKQQSLEGYEWNCQTVPSSSTTLTLTRKSGLVLDHVSQFSVRGQNYDRQAGEWVSVTQMIDWNYQCRLPSCTAQRQERPDKTINDFCCKEHGRRFADLYCLYGDYPGCCHWKASPLGAKTPAYFCEMHLQQAKEEGFAAVVELDSQSQTYKDLSKKFQKTWAKEKGPCPPIITIVKIVNPMVEERFESYRSRFLVYRGIERHYHGTTLCCDLANYAELCNDPNCGACGIARRGFDPQRINLSAWQRFGNGFYFAPNSSKSYDYAAGNRFGATVTVRNTCYNAVLVCDIAPGRKYGIRYHTPHLLKPPPDYNSFHGKSKGIMGKGELNYDELVIFDYEAIRPRYIIFC